MNSWLEIKVNHGLETHLKRIRDFAGSRGSITFSIISDGIVITRLISIAISLSLYLDQIGSMLQAFS